MNRQLYRDISDLVIDDSSVAQILDYFSEGKISDSKSVINALSFMSRKGIVKFYKYYDDKRNYVAVDDIDFHDVSETRIIITEQTDLTFGFYRSNKDFS